MVSPCAVHSRFNHFTGIFAVLRNEPSTSKSQLPVAVRRFHQVFGSASGIPSHPSHPSHRSGHRLLLITPSPVLGHSSIRFIQSPQATVLIDMRTRAPVFDIYCGGSLLAAVQNSKIFIDCKHFVDMPLKLDPEVTLAAWNILESQGEISDEQVKSFVEAHFDEPGCELEEVAPVDFHPDTKAYDVIHDESYREWAQVLHKKWPTLTRRVKDLVHGDPSRYSLIALPHPFIVPGGRFRELYYWDSFFTIKGLIASQMFETVRGMIHNMQFLIEQYGFVPNGNRIYYLNRSQPPVLAWCVHAYYKATKDTEFIAQLLPTLRKEMAFFENNRVYKEEHWIGSLYRYVVSADGPRPESYREDVESAHHLCEESEKRRLWGDIAAAAESGRDFSARWFESSGPHAGKMSGTRTSQLIPVELNAIIYANYRMMGELCDSTGDIDGAKRCAHLADRLKQAIKQILWNEELGCWFDFDLVSREQTKQFNDTNLFPMFAECVHEGFDGARLCEYLKKSGALGYPGGLPSSMVASGQQWDFPNAWAPTTWIAIQGLRACQQHEMAHNIAEKWIRKNFNMWRSSGGKMFEKYNVVSPCYKVGAGGGEYDVQEGFGWTNGVVLDLLTTYGDSLQWVPGDECECCQGHIAPCAAEKRPL
ncbi:unnamed protein product, partial [Mesorhabditis belari]|uniref:Trehalase n=1 Tax=Mesorhabditis belari TaxID=2138241 RepID=A0AAF3FEN2_9BILA